MGQQTSTDLGEPGDEMSCFHLVQSLHELRSARKVSYIPSLSLQSRLPRVSKSSHDTDSHTKKQHHEVGSLPFLQGPCLLQTEGMGATQRVLSLPNCDPNGSSPAAGSTLSLQQNSSSPNERMDN